MVKVHIFKGRERFRDYLDAVREVPEGTVSPGGAAQLLHCTRQYVHKLLKQGRLEAWMYYEDRYDRPSYVEIAIRDVERYAEEFGRGEPEDYARTVDSSKPCVLG